MFLKLFSAANKYSGRRRKEMSFLRRLFIQGRALLNEYQIFGQRKCYNSGVPDWRYLKIELPPRGRGLGGGSANPGHRSGPSPTLSLPELSNSSAGRISGNAARPTSPTSTLQWVGQEVRKIFINNVLSRVTANEQIAKQTAQRLLYGDSRPFFALVGVSLAAGTTGMLTQENEFDNLCWEIRESMLKKQKNTVSDMIVPDGTITIKDLRFGHLIKQGCNAAVYSAEWKTQPQSNLNQIQRTQNEKLAVKMLFNYDIESNASTILRAMVREIVPARNVSLDNINELDHDVFVSVKRCPPHENIIEITHAFVDQIPILPDGIEKYPSALPRRLNPVDGLGRNMSLFLVMKRYDCNLADFLANKKELNFKTRLIILTQILDAVSHLEKNKIAHRDLKTDNILVDLSEGEETPKIVLTDFGCCLADKSNGLQLPFRSIDTERGGNAALMSPEVSTAKPGSWKWISYEKSDVWSVGAIAYEVFGDTNPFYKTNPSVQPLDSRSYKETDLRMVSSGAVPRTIKNLVLALLKRNANERLSAQEAAIICHLQLWAPSAWLTSLKTPSDDEIMQWLVTLTTKTLCHGSDELQYRMIQDFLRKIKFRDLRSAAEWIHQNR